MKIVFNRPRTWMDPVDTARNKQSRCVCQRFDCESVLTVRFFRTITRIDTGILIDSVCSGRKITQHPINTWRKEGSEETL